MPTTQEICFCLLGLLVLFVAVWSLALSTNTTQRLFQCVRLTERVVEKLEALDKAVEAAQTQLDHLEDKFIRNTLKPAPAPDPNLVAQVADLSKRFDILDHYVALRDIRLGPNLSDAVRSLAISADGQGERLTERPHKPPAAPAVPPLS